MEPPRSLVFIEEQHYQNTCDNVGELWKQRALCDVNLLLEDAEGQPRVSIPAHKVILAASVPYFRAMFSSGMQESSRDEVRLKSMDEMGLKAIVGYVYSGRIELMESTVQGILSTASLLGLQNIVDASARFMTKHLSPSNCIGVSSFSALFNLENLRSAADKYAQRNFAQVVREEEFLGLSVEEVESFVSSEQISVESEEVVYNAVTKWINHDKSSEADKYSENAGRIQFVERLYNHVRFPILDLNLLKGVVLHNQLITSNPPAKLMVKEALKYHENPASIILFSNPKKTQPRSSMMGVICVVGGAGEAGESLIDVTFFNPHEKQWKSGTKMLQHRSRLALALFGGELYAIGGADVRDSLATVEKYSPVTNQWEMVAPLRTARKSCAAVVTRAGIYVLGGFSGSVFLHSVELYNPQLDEWSYQIPMLEARSDLCAVFFDQRIYAIGGSNSTTQLRSVERFDLMNRKWEVVADMYAPRANAGTYVCTCVYDMAAGADSGIPNRVNSAFLIIIGCYCRARERHIMFILNLCFSLGMGDDLPPTHPPNTIPQTCSSSLDDFKIVNSAEPIGNFFFDIILFSQLQLLPCWGRRSLLLEGRRTRR